MIRFLLILQVVLAHWVIVSGILPNRLELPNTLEWRYEAKGTKRPALTPHAFHLVADYLFMKNFHQGDTSWEQLYLRNQVTRALALDPALPLEEAQQRAQSHCTQLKDFLKGVQDIQSLEMTQLRPIDEDQTLQDAWFLLKNEGISLPQLIGRRSITLDVSDLQKAAKKQPVSTLQPGDFDLLALEYLKLSRDSFTICVYPTAFERLDEVKALFLQRSLLVYEKRFQLTPRGCERLMERAYGHLGKKRIRFEKSHLKDRFPEGAPLSVHVIFVQAGAKRDMKSTKAVAREFFNQGRFPLHSTDKHEETIILAEALLDPQGFAQLNK